MNIRNVSKSTLILNSRITITSSYTAYHILLITVTFRNVPMNAHECSSHIIQTKG